jgi:hypothetical protein
MVLALSLGPAFVASRLPALLGCQAVIAVAAAIGMVTTLPVRAPEGVALVSAHPLRTVWQDPVIRLLVAIAALGFGVFIALTERSA